ncbi:MAG: hypothetical protein AAF602_26885, partial [Myxococcota bacterium]
PHRFEQHSIDALWSMGALAGVGFGLGAVHLGRLRLARPVERLLAPEDRPRNGVAAAVWSGVTIAWGSAILSMVWVGFMADVGWASGGILWLSTWALGATALAVTYGGWLASIGTASDDALRAAGGALVGQAVVPFVFALSPALGRDPELQFAYLLVTTLLATTGAFLWGYAQPHTPAVEEAPG